MKYRSHEEAYHLKLQ